MLQQDGICIVKAYHYLLSMHLAGWPEPVVLFFTDDINRDRANHSVHAMHAFTYMSQHWHKSLMFIILPDDATCS